MLDGDEHCREKESREVLWVLGVYVQCQVET